MRRPSSARLIRSALRLGIGIGVVTLLLARADVSEMAEAVRGAAIGDVFIGTTLFFASLLLSSLRWEAFLSSLDIVLPPRDLNTLRLIGSMIDGQSFVLQMRSVPEEILSSKFLRVTRAMQV